MLRDLLDFAQTKEFVLQQAPLFRSFQGFSGKIGILSEDYFSLVNPMFAICIDDLSVLVPFKIVSFRDGFLGLGCFFSRFPIPPKNFKTMIGIPTYFASLVPRSWQGNIYFYQFKLKNPSSIHSHFFCSLGLEWSQKNLENHIQKYKIKSVGKIDFLQDESLLNSFLVQMDLTGHKFYFNHSLFYVYDHFLIHALMSKNALVSIPEGEITIEEKIDLSLFHEVKLSLTPPKDFGILFKSFFQIWNNTFDNFFQDAKLESRYRDLFNEKFIQDE